MCGIAGIINYENNHISACRRVLKMIEVLHHRGPDDCGINLRTHAVLGHTRLSLIDLQGGVQSFCSKNNRYTITYNGEIYNYKELRDELSEQWAFSTHSDTEVVLAAYSIWGEECLKKLNGMFSFFIWDEFAKTGFAARDLLGIKPFVYSYNDNEFIFSSEEKAIVSILTSPVYANDEAVLEYLAVPYFSGVEYTMYSGIHNLLPGHCMTVNEEGVEITQWGDYVLAPSTSEDDSLKHEMRQSVVNAVEKSLTADVPVGTYLSGGLDSTLVTSIAQNHTSHRIRAFTINFENQNEFDHKKALITSTNDTPYAISAAEDIGVDLSVVNVDNKNLSGNIRELVLINDILPAWEEELTSYYLAKEAVKYYKAILVGDASDETHWGYQYLLDKDAIQSPAGILNRFKLPVLNKKLVANPLDYYNNKYKELVEKAGYSWDSESDRYLATCYLVVKRWLPRLLRNGDAYSMSCSLEARIPFADTNLLEVARKIHPQSGFKNNTEKSLLRESVKGLVPENIRTRTKSSTPKDQGASRLYKKIVRKLLQDSLNLDFIAYYLDINSIINLCESRVDLHESEYSLLFRIICLCHWRTHFNIQYGG